MSFRSTIVRSACAVAAIFVAGHTVGVVAAIPDGVVALPVAFELAEFGGSQLEAAAGWPDPEEIRMACKAGNSAWVEGDLWTLTWHRVGADFTISGPDSTFRLPLAGPVGEPRQLSMAAGGDHLVVGVQEERGLVWLYSVVAREKSPIHRQIASFEPTFDYRRLDMVATASLSGLIYAVIGVGEEKSEITIIEGSSGNVRARLELPLTVLCGQKLGLSHLLLVGNDDDGQSVGILLQIDTRKWSAISLPPNFPERLVGAMSLQSTGDSGQIAVIDEVGGTLVLTFRVTPEAAHIAGLDTIVLSSYLVLVLLVGVVCGRRIKSGREMFLGGGRIPGWASGLSIVLTNISAISFIALPSRAFAIDSTMLLFLLGPAVAAPIVIKFILPILRKGAYLTAYEILGVHFGPGFRKLGAWFYCVYELGRTGVLLVIPSIIISMMTGMSVSACILLTALVTIIYTCFGGFEAVVWTDVIQGVIMLIALILTPLLVFYSIGSPGEAVKTASMAGRLQLINGSTSLGQEGWVVLILALLSAFNSYLWHQPTVQRLLSAKDERAVKSAVITAAISSPLMLSLMFFGGAMLYAFYAAFPERMSVVVGGRDEVFPSFVMREMPPGLSGLVIAAIFAASMSSLSSGINSISSVISGDIVSATWRERIVEKQSFSRWISCVAGITGSLIALVVAEANALSLFDIFIEFTNLLSGSLTGVFVLALLGNRFGTLHAAIGFICSIVVVAAAKISGNFSFMLYATLGTGTCVAVGYAATLVFRPTAAGRYSGT